MCSSRASLRSFLSYTPWPFLHFGSACSAIMPGGGHLVVTFAATGVYGGGVCLSTHRAWRSWSFGEFRVPVGSVACDRSIVLGLASVFLEIDFVAFLHFGSACSAVMLGGCVPLNNGCLRSDQRAWRLFQCQCLSACRRSCP